jgi:exopolysaccharide production protein ExoY
MFYADQNDRVDVPDADEAHYGSGPQGSTRSGPVGGLLKRALDIIVAVAALILLAPLLAAVSLLVAVTMGRPLLEGHKRIGFAGRTFTDYTFRADPESATGALLKKSGIDGLPRLINVLKGEMSCVGPRPLVAAELQDNEADSYVRARPGMTGRWRLAHEAPSEAAAVDSAYVHNWSMHSDIVILLKAIPGVARGENRA